MNKKVIILHDEKSKCPIKVLEVKTFTDYEDYQKFVELANENYERITAEREAKKLAKEDALNERLERYERAVAELSLEVDLLRGRITEEEYNERMSQL